MEDDENREPTPVTLRNTQRRPLTFRVAGQTVRLSPGESLDVREAWLGSAELNHFCRSGVITATVAQSADTEPAEGESESERPKGRKTAKPGRPQPTSRGE